MWSGRARPGSCQGEFEREGEKEERRRRKGEEAGGWTPDETTMQPRPPARPSARRVRLRLGDGAAVQGSTRRSQDSLRNQGDL